MAKDLAKIVVSLEAESARLTAELEKANRSLDRFAKQADGAAARFKQAMGAVGVVLAGVSFKGLVDGAVEAASEARNLATRLGGTVEEWTRLSYAATQADVGFSAAAQSLQRMTRRISEAAQGGGEAIGALNELGLSAQRMADLTPVEQMQVLADALASVEKQSDKVRVAMRLFDSEGVKMLQLLEGGSQRFQSLAEQSDQFGVTLNAAAADSMMEYEKAMKALDAASSGFANTLAQAVAPALSRVANWFGEVSEAAGEAFASLSGQHQFAFGDDLEKIRDRIKEIQTELEGPGKKTRAWYRHTARLNAELRDLQTRDPYSQQQKALDEIVRLKEKLDSLGGGGRSGRSRRESINQRLEEQQRLYDEATAAIRRYENGVKVAAPTLENFAGVNHKAATAAKHVAKTASKLTDEQRAYNAALREAAAITESVKTPAERYEDALFRINELYQDNLVSFTTYERAVKKAQDEFDKATALTGEKVKEAKQSVDELGLAFSSAFEDAVVNGQKLSDVLKGLERDILRLIMRRAVTKPLEEAVASIGVMSFDFGSLFGGFRAAGGPVSAGTAYVVGERGPELFVPRQSGAIVPNGAALATPVGGGGDVVVNVIEAPGRGGEVSHRQEGGQRIVEVFVEQVKTSIAGDIATGSGSVPQALQRVYGLNRAAGSY